MARIKLTIPANIIGRITIPVRITDINYGNHLGNDALVSITHEARMSWLAKHGLSELDTGGTGLIMSDLAVEYINESFYGDVLEVAIAAEGISSAGFELYYDIRTERDGKQLTVARAKTGMVCYDYSRKRIAAIPDGLKKLLHG